MFKLALYLGELDVERVNILEFTLVLPLFCLGFLEIQDQINYQKHFACFFSHYYLFIQALVKNYLQTLNKKHYYNFISLLYKYFAFVSFYIYFLPCQNYFIFLLIIKKLNYFNKFLLKYMIFKKKIFNSNMNLKNIRG